MNPSLWRPAPRLSLSTCSLLFPRVSSNSFSSCLCHLCTTRQPCLDLISKRKMSELISEIRKIPPVTRFICTSLFSITLPCLLAIVPTHNLVFYKAAVTDSLQVCKVARSTREARMFTACTRYGDCSPPSSLEVCSTAIARTRRVRLRMPHALCR